jgi:protease-4
MSSYKKAIKTNLIKEEIGEQQLRALQELKKVKQMVGTPQARLPFSVSIH